MATTYRANGQVETVTDANGNKTTYVYDGHDRLSRTRMPDPSTAGTSSTTDYEELTYATATVGGNTVSTPLVASRRLRDGRSIGYGYDALGRLAAKDLPVGEADVAYSYDLLGRLTQAIDANTFLAQFAYDGLGRVASETDTFNGALSYQYDLAGRRTRLAWRGRQSMSTTSTTWPAQMTAGPREWRDLGRRAARASMPMTICGRRTSLTRGNGTMTSYSYDTVSRLSGLTQNLNGGTQRRDLRLRLQSGERDRVEHALERRLQLHVWPTRT